MCLFSYRIHSKHIQRRDKILQHKQSDEIRAVPPFHQSGRAAADMERAENVRLAPLHDLAQLVPVFHLLKGHLLHRRAGDDESVKVLIPEFVERLVEGDHVIFGSVFRFVGVGVHQHQLHLQGRVAQQAAELCFRVDLGRHQVQQHDLQRTDVLRDGAGLGHHENIFFGQRFGRGQIIGYTNRHGAVSPLISYTVSAEGLLQIGDQVGGVLKAAGIADEVGADAGG